MSELPENIWTWPFVSAKQNEFMTGGWHDEPEPHPTGKETRYIRYDKHTGYLADIKAAFGEACDRIAELEVNINLKADWIEHTINDMAVDKATIVELESLLLRAADDIEKGWLAIDNIEETCNTDGS